MLRSCLQRTFAGHGQVALIAGEPGIGKTTLLQQLQSDALAAGAFAAWGRCWAGDGVPAFWPWMQLVRSVVETTEPAALAEDLGLGAAEIAQIVPEVRARFPDLAPPIRLDPDQERFRVFESITSFLIRVAMRRPLVLIVDDLHWADPASARLLHFAARQSAGSRLLLASTYRNTELRSGHPLHERLLEICREPAAQLLTLEGLSLDEAREWMASVAGRAPAASLATAIHRATAGNPFFMSQMRGLLVEEGERDELRAEADTKTLPRDVMEAIATRFAPLSASCRAVLEVAALIGREYSLDLLQRVARGNKLEMPDGIALVEALDEAHAARLITETRRDPAIYGFAHDLVRESLIGTMPVTRRLSIHREIGEAIARAHDAETHHIAKLAYHFREVAASGACVDRAIRYSVLAAEHASRLAAHESAVTHLRAVLRLREAVGAPASPDADWTLEHAQLWLRLGEAETRSAEPGADASFERAASAARLAARGGDPAAAGVLMARIALARGGDGLAVNRIDRDRVALIDEALDALGEAAPSLRAELLAHKAILHCWAPDATLFRRLSGDAVEAAEQSGDQEALFRALDAQHLSLWNDPSVESRLAVLKRMERIAGERGDLRRRQWCQYWRSIALAELGRMVEADAAIEAQEQLALQLREPHRRFLPAYLRAMRALMSGEREEALRLAEKARELGERAGVPDAGLISIALRFQVTRDVGRRYNEALTLLSFRPADRGAMTGLDAAVATLLAESGEIEASREVIAELCRNDLAVVQRDANWIPVLAMLTDAVAEVGAVEYAALLRRHLEPYDGRLALGGMGAVCLGFVGRSLARIAVLEERWEEAFAYFERASKQTLQADARPWLATTRIEHGLALIARARAEGDAGSRRQAARTLLQAGHSEAKRLDLARIEEIARRALEELGSGRQAPPQGGRTPVPRGVARCKRDDRHWNLTFSELSARVPDSKGMRYVAELLGRPGDAVHCIELELVANASAASDPIRPAAESLRVQLGSGSTDPALDARALREIRARLADLRETLERAEQLNDLDRASRAREEIDFLTQQLAITVGLGGRSRNESGDASERSRLRVTQRIKATLQALRAVHPALADHLARSVQTGVLCSYGPPPDEAPGWEL